MTINTSLKELSPSLRDRLYNREIEEVAIASSYHKEVVKRMLAGNADKYGYKEENVARVVAHAFEVMKKREGVEQLEELFKPYMAA